MIDGIDARGDDEGVEVGLFCGEECVQVLQLDEDKARRLHKHLGEAIERVYPTEPGADVPTGN
ncbi:MAG: hypothetical protein ACYCV6_01255 [Steroidobacteraceae bacterium]|jgi:hypothetical protein